MSEHYRPTSGGSATYAVMMSEALAASGCAVNLLTYTPLPEYPPRQWLKVGGVSLFNVGVLPWLGYNTRRGRHAFTFWIRRHLARLLKEIRPDVIHVLYGHTVPWVFHGIPEDVPTVWTVHNVPPHEYGSAVRTFLPAADILLQHAHATLAGAVHRQRLRSFSWDRLIAVSRRTQDRLAAISLSPAHMTVIPNGVDTEAFQPGTEENNTEAKRRCRLTGDPVILSVAGVIPHKGQLTVIRALALLREQFPRIQFVNIGDIRDSVYHARVLREVRELDLARSCSFLPGNVPEDALVEFYRACDVYVQPSLEEGFGIALLEAVSVGCAVVGTATGALAQIVDGSQAGMMILPEDPRALAAAIRELLNPRSPHRRDPATLHAYVSQQYSWRAVAQQTIALYETLLRDPSSRRRQSSAQPR